MQNLEIKKDYNSYRMYKMVNSYLGYFNNLLWFIAIVEFIKLILFFIQLKG